MKKSFLNQTHVEGVLYEHNLEAKVSGAMRKLVTDGFVEKVGQDPVIYSITENGKNINIE